MSKQITAADLATIVTNLLTNPEGAGELASFGAYQSFMTAIAQVVCNHCGGEIRTVASPLDDIWYVGIHGNDSLPESGGIWREFDQDGELFPETEGDTSDGPRDVFGEIMRATSMFVDAPDFQDGEQAIVVRHDLLANELLSRLPAKTIITRELYEADGDVGEAMVWISSHFDFRNWEGRTIADLLMEFHPHDPQSASRNVLQYRTTTTNGDGVHAKNVSLADLRAAAPVPELGWRLSTGVTIWIDPRKQAA